MDASESLSISASLSKVNLEEDFSIFRACMEDASGREWETISNEKIVKDTELLETYKVLSDAIHGGMGSVFRVRHMNWNIDLAMKRPQPRFFSEAGPERRAEFVRECENWINLGLHPNIVSCYYVREIGGVPSIFSEWMDGGSLKDCIREGRLYEGTDEEIQERILDIAIQAARGLQYSHENQLIHQDVKPGNILLTGEWDAGLADFGLAQAVRQLSEEPVPDEGNEGIESSAMSPNRPAGYTLQYCPQEQADGDKPEPWMDAYAFAVTVLEMYAGGRQWETGAEVKEKAEEVFASCKVRVPGQLQGLLVSCLQASSGSFAHIEQELEDIYRRTVGWEYPRAQASAASETAGSLNNRALSFLDLGQPEASKKLWKQALYLDESCVPVLFNRELQLVRSGEKYDIEAVKTLEENPACLREDASVDIREEWDRSHPLFEPFAFEIEGKATSAILCGDYIYFTYNDDLDKEQYDKADDDQKWPHIKRVRKDGQGECRIDYLKEVRLLGPPVVKIAIQPGGMYAAILLADGTLCLYDPVERTLLRAVKTLPNDCMEPIITYLPDLCYAYSRSGDILTFYNTMDNASSVIVEIPSMMVIYGSAKYFAGYSVNDLPLVKDRKTDELFEIGTDGSETRVTRDWFYKIPLQVRAADRRKLNDPAGGFWYLARYIRGEMRICVYKAGTEPCQFTVRSENIESFLLDGTDQVLTWGNGESAGKKMTRWSRSALIPVPVKARPAVYKLSRIVTAKKRFQEDEALLRMEQLLRTCLSNGDHERALKLFDDAKTNPGFYTSRAGKRMDEAIDREEEKYALRHVRMQPEELDQKARSGLFFLQDDCVCVTDDLFAYMPYSHADDRRQITLYNRDQVRVGRFETPAYMTNVRIKKDRIIVWADGTFCRAVYDLEGNLLCPPAGGWPASRLPKDQQIQRIFDIDYTGRYVLFGFQKKEDAEGSSEQSGFFEKDLETGRIIRLADYRDLFDRLNGYGYLDDGTMVIRTGTAISRFQQGTGEKILTYRLSNPEFHSLYIDFSPDSSRFMVHVIKDKGKLENHGSSFFFIDTGKDDIYGFEKEGTCFWHESDTNLRHMAWFPGGRFVCFYGRNGYKIVDLETGHTAFTSDNLYVDSAHVYLQPDGRKLYYCARRGKFENVKVFDLEFDYKVKGTPDIPRHFAPASLIEYSEDHGADSENASEPPEKQPEPEPRGLDQITFGAAIRRIPEKAAENPEDFKYSAGSPVEVEREPDILYRDHPVTRENNPSVTIPAGFRRIDTGCFRNSTSVRTVIIPEGVTDIGNEAFRSCVHLEKVTLPRSLSRIGRGAFRECISLKQISLPPGMREIGSAAFRNCYGLKHIDLPDGITEIEDDVFNGCTDMTSISLPDGLIKIGESAFEACVSLEDVYIPDTVQTIGKDAFARCRELKRVRLPRNLEGKVEFKGCNNLQEDQIGADILPGRPGSGFLKRLFGRKR